ncbi:PKD domain-containing protein [Streptomyces sp. NPDC005373]|uniref:PKD domain-containing protein n=1 Tax=Streptomyces sp. NPDC005373 TaxID=3156879 RepID=UPI0033AB2427
MAKAMVPAGTAVAGLLLCLLPVQGASAAPAECAAREPGGPVWVTADCVDPQYKNPVIDSETEQTRPVRHHRVSGHFEGTNVKFNVYLPPKDQWKGRFFQYVYPIQDANATDETIGFGADSGAYTVQITGTAGYRADAAAAKYAETVAADYYDKQGTIYGYIWGGSGGSYQTIAAMENTTGVWDGAVPFIPGVPTSIPNNFFARAFARVVLQDKAAQIADAVSPGGSGDPYAGLNKAQSTALREVTRLGVPLRGWENYRYLLGVDDPQGLMGFAELVRSADPTYADDFWSKPGYLGTEKSPLGDVIRAARVDHLSTITQADAKSATLDSAAPTSRTPLDFTLYAADGTTRIGTLKGTLKDKAFTIGDGNSAEVLAGLKAGAKVRSDNSWSLALTSYHRHQVPTRPGYYAWDQFRDADGKPIYPQRAAEVGPGVSAGVSGGGTHTGKITGKMLMVGNLLDVDAYPWDADWYAKQVGSDTTFRVWYNGNADHIGPHAPNLVNSMGVLQQALRDVSAWAEHGVQPPQSTRYRVKDSQVSVPAKADERHGVQPVIDLTADGRGSIDVPAGKPVTFKARVQTPSGTGKVVSTDWDFKGDGTFTTRPCGTPNSTVEVSASFTYSKPGTYFPALRAVSQRDGDSSTPYAKIQNLGRMRVVVR